VNQNLVSSIDTWLARLGLAQYVRQFRLADIDVEVLPHLSDSDLRELGVQSLGHRRKIMGAAKETTSHYRNAERRFITVLFVDIVGSTALAERLGAEQYAELLGLYHRTVERIAQQYGGHVAQFLGDGALIYFGSPVPLEDAAARAAMTALRLPAAIETMGHNLPGVKVRIGVASGLVVLGEQNLGEPAAVGQTLNLAARLQEIAAPGGTVVSESTAALVREQFDLSDMGPVTLKGLTEPRPAYRLDGEQTSHLGLNLLSPAQSTRFVNRTEEIARLSTAFGDAMNRGVSILVTGDAGIGKTRLVAEFLEMTKSQGAGITRFACSPLGVAIPFFAFRRPLELAAQDGDSRAAEISNMLGTQDGGTLIQRREQRRSTIAALANYFQADDNDLPAVILVEDLHWADPSSIEALEKIAPQSRAKRLLLMTSRNEEDLKHLPGSRHLAVLPLSRAHTCDIVRDRLGDVDGWQALVAPLADRADGVPIFAEELASEMRHRRQANGPDEFDIPTSLQQSLQARIDRLGPGRPLLRLIASLARVCPVDLVRKLWSDDQRLEEAIADLTASGLALLVPGQGNEVSGWLEIKHQMVRECAYDMILAKDRKTIHRSIAAVLEGSAGAQLNPAMLAEQLERSGQVRKAAERWAEAGRLAARQSADAEAVTLFKRALTLLPRANLSDWANEFELETVLSLYPALIGAHGYSAANAELSEHLNALIARETNPERVVAALLFQWVGMVTQGDIDSSGDLLSGVDRHAVIGSDPVLNMIWDRMLGSTLMFQGRLQEARDVLNRMISAYDPAKHKNALASFGATDNFVTVLCCISAIDALEEKPDSSLEALVAAEKSQHFHTICHTLTFGVAFPAAIRQDWQTMVVASERLRKLSADRNLQYWDQFATYYLALDRLQRGEIEGGQALCNAVISTLQKQGDNFLIPTLRILALSARAPFDPPGREEVAILKRQAESGERWVLPILDKLRVA